MKTHPRTVLMLPDFRAGNPYQRLLAEALRDQGWTVLFPPGRRRGLPLLRAVREARPAVLHLHWLHPYLRDENRLQASLYAVKLVCDLLLVKRSGVRLVWTVHNLLPHEARFPGVHRWARRRLLGLADAVLVHSKPAAERVASYFGIDVERLSVVGHGGYRSVYGPPLERAVARRQLGLPAEETLYLHFGQLRPYKRLDRVLGWWQQRRPGNARLLLVGECPDPAYAGEIEGRLAGTGVEWRRGRVADGEVAAWICAADVLLQAGDQLTSGVLALATGYDTRVVHVGAGELVEGTVRWSDVAKGTKLAYER